MRRPTRNRNVDIANAVTARPGGRASDNERDGGGPAAISDSSRSPVTDGWIRSAATNAAPNVRVVSASTHSGPICKRMPPSAPATIAASPLSSWSLEFASTSSMSPATVDGTTAALAIWYVFASTSIANASGNSARLSLMTAIIIVMATTTRSAIVAWMTTRWPPFTRSIIGPMSGPTSANGAIVNSRPRMTFSRPWAGSTLKKNEPARLSTTRVSPDTESRWHNASRGNAASQSTLRRRGGRVSGCQPSDPAPVSAALMRDGPGRSPGQTNSTRTCIPRRGQ